MDNNSRVKTIQEVYSAFGRGDIPAILEQTDDDTEWSFNVSNSKVPWHSGAKSKAALPQFFSNLVENVDIKAFEPCSFINAGDEVIAHIHIEYRVNRTGKDVCMDQLHWWTFNKEGKISRLVHFEDTAQVIAAYSG